MMDDFMVGPQCEEFEESMQGNRRHMGLYDDAFDKELQDTKEKLFDYIATVLSQDEDCKNADINSFWKIIGDEDNV
jgi:hypothetical protein